MTEGNPRDWVEIAEKLLVPVVIAAVGTLYSMQKDRSDKAMLQSSREAEAARWRLERDTGYMRMVASTNEKERELGLRLIEVLVGKNEFTPELVALVAAVAGGSQEDASTRTANRILTDASANDEDVREQIADTAANSPTAVYIRVTRNSQRTDALVLQEALRRAGFGTPQIQVLDAAEVPSDTFVRYYGAESAQKAYLVNELMRELGYSSTLQDFSSCSQTALSSIEVWIGEKQGRLRGEQPAVIDQRAG